MRKSKDKDGYIRVHLPDHPRSYYGTVAEHTLVLEEYLDRWLPEGTIVHHRNRVRSDNRIENLLLLRCEEDHLTLHRAINRGDAVLVAAFEESAREFMAKLKMGRAEDECFSCNSAYESDEEVTYSQEEGLAESFESIGSSERFSARRNKVTKKPFLEVEDELLIGPDGQEVAIDFHRFGELEEVSISQLTEKQLQIYKNKLKDLDSAAAEEKNKLAIRDRLFHALRAERNAIARKTGRIHYYIFDDKTLRDMAEIMPTTKAMMLQVNGVKDIKFNLYGERFIDVIRKFIGKLDRAS